MPKNITVTDAQGNLCQPTWPKRAKGLVKHGRAVYVSDNHIRLTPPERKTEEKAMTANDILQKIFELSQDKKHINDALMTLLSMPKADYGVPGAPPNVEGQAKAQAISEVACAAETTRQQLLSFYIRVYDSLTGNAQVAPAAVLPEAKEPEADADPVDYAALSMKIAEEYA